MTIDCINNDPADLKAQQNAYITTTKKVKEYYENLLRLIAPVIIRGKNLQREKLNAVENMQIINDASKKMIKKKLDETFADFNKELIIEGVAVGIRVEELTDKIKIAQSNLSRLENKATA